MFGRISDGGYGLPGNRPGPMVEKVGRVQPLQSHTIGQYRITGSNQSIVFNALISIVYLCKPDARVHDNKGSVGDIQTLTNRVLFCGFSGRWYPLVINHALSRWGWLMGCLL